MTTQPMLTPRYMVRVTIPADGATPSEAARKFVEHVTLHGFSSLTYNVEDLIEGERYLATLEGWATLADVKAELGDDKGTIWIQSVDPELVEEGEEIGPFETHQAALSRLSLLDVDPDDWEIVDRSPISTEYALIGGEGEEEGEGEDTLHEESETIKRGKCRRCKTDAALNSDKLCEACVEDITGAPR